MSNENHPPRVQRITPIYSTLSYANIVKTELLADHQPQIPNENDKSGSHAEHTVKMPTENDKPPEVSCAAALRMGLPAPKTSDQNNCPNLAGECSLTVSSNADTQTTHTTQGASPSRSTVAPNSGTSTGSSDQSLAASRSTQPVLFLRSVAANCGCVYIAETGIGGHPSHDDLRESGFPVRGRCPQCKVLVTEIRLNEDGQAEVTEINQPPEEEHDEQDGYSEDVEDIYVDEEDVDDYESGEAPQS